MAPARKKARSLEDIQAEIARLEQEAKAIRDAELGEVIAKIKTAIKHYGLTASDLGLAPKVRTAAKKAATKASKASKASKKSGAAKAPRPAKYRDDKGNEWVGQGKRPKWFVEALASGKTAEDLLVKP